MRKKHTGQPLDHLFRKLNKLIQKEQLRLSANALFSDETTLQELNDLHDKASSFTPRSDYEVKDKKNLLQQINDLKDFLQL